MWRRLPILSAVLTAILSAQDRPTFQIAVSQVHVDAEVVSKDGHLISGLSSSDFRIFDERQEQEVVGFAAEEQPLDIILLFDISGSMRVKVEKVVGAAHQAMQVLRRGDRVSVMTFNTSTRLVSSFTDDLSSVERDIEEVLGLRFGGGTRIHQAVYDAANNFQQERRTQRRRVVLIITDNLGTRTRSEMSVIRNMWEADALLSGLVIPDHWFPVRKAIVAVMAPYALLNSGKGMDNIAEKTGGDTIRTDDPGAMFPEMMRRIRNRYSLYYPMPEGKPGEWRSIRAELTPETQQRFPGARVVARRGYRLSPP